MRETSKPLRVPRHGSLAGGLFVRGAVAFGELHVACSSGLERARGALESFLRQALSTEERASLVHELFGRRHSYGPPGLQPWEQLWYERDLPRAPARVLVGGAGAGRELRALLGLDYTVFGFEPSERLAAAARARLPSGTPLWVLSYEGLLEPAGARELAAGAPYDAVILGWGSFAHVLDAAQRERVLQRVQQICPRGPILLSVPLVSRAWLGRARSGWQERAERLGRHVQRLRHLPPVADDHDAFLPHAGFIHRFTVEEVEGLARALRRMTRWGDTPDAYPHCTLSMP